MGDEPGRVKIVPALCTQCAARIEVDQSKDAAICPHCGTAFVVEKAVNNFNIQFAQNTHFDYVDTVNIHTSAKDMPGSTLYILDKIISNRTARKIEREKLKAEKEKREAEERARQEKYMPYLMTIILGTFIVVFFLMSRK